ncbi:MAG TPA: hypothetical protein VH475_08215 [Tepidisphaeraceae bacterium]|jgi:hypothetical protein
MRWWVILGLVLTAAMAGAADDKPVVPPIDPDVFKEATARLAAKATTRPDEIARLKAENSALRAEIANLKLQVEQLQHAAGIDAPVAQEQRVQYAMKTHTPVRGMSLAQLTTFASIRDMDDAPPDDGHTRHLRVSVLRNAGSEIYEVIATDGVITSVQTFGVGRSRQWRPGAP